MKQLMRISQRHIAAALFAGSAIALLGVWYVYLFVSIPVGQSAAEHALSLMVFSFAESGAPGHFALLAVLPVAFLFLSVLAWQAQANIWRPTSWGTVLAAVCTGLVLLVYWEVVLFAGFATYLSIKQRAG